MSSPLEAGRSVLAEIAAALTRAGKKGGIPDLDQAIDAHQMVAYDLAFARAELDAAAEALDFAQGKPLETRLAELAAGEALLSIRSRVAARPTESGVEEDTLARTIDSAPVKSFLEKALSPATADAIVEGLAARAPERGLTTDQEAFASAFRAFSEGKVAPLAEKIHREDLLVPREILEGLKELGCFGLSIPTRYGGIQPDDRPDNMGMVVVTEELSRGSLAAAGSLITRPEILAKALLKGGSEEQKAKWLPRLASGEAMAAVAVTEPDHGSDVAGIKVTAARTKEGWKLNGVKTWCTFAGFANVLMVLARTDPDRSKRHKGLSLFIAEKPSFEGHSFETSQPGGGTMSGRAIPTIGYRGMHSYEVSFEDWLVPPENLIGTEGQGFYLQMEGFSGGRLQTAARALGVMQAAFEAAYRYAHERKLFGKAEIELGLPRMKLARMAAWLHACRQSTYRAARLLDQGDRKGAIAASMVKLLACRTAEWVTREAMQLHGGMGYAEEFPVSRHFLDARVLSIFEGAEEVLALKVVAKALVEEAFSTTATRQAGARPEETVRP